MSALTLAEIADVTGGTLHDAPNPQATVTGAASDSRAITPGCLFAAIAGARVDGHIYAADAVRAGAAAVLAQRPVGVPAVVVEDTVTALGQLARHVLQSSRAEVVALTGSAGKTTTKDLLGQVLSRHGRTVATPGSFNTEVGLPLTVLGMDTDTRYLVLEMGARHRGDLAYLCSLTPPTTGIVLNVGTAHIGEFGSREDIAGAKSELVQALPAADAGGVAILNADDDLVDAMAAQTKAAVLRFGLSETADIRATDIRVDGGRATFTLTVRGSAEKAVALQLFGEHQVLNALAVAAAAYSLGMKISDIAAALSEAAPISAGRLEVLERGDITIVNDAFNANPDSVRAALDTVASIAGSRRVVAVLGEMRELGEITVAAHREVGRIVAERGVAVLVTVGENASMTTLADAAGAGVRRESAADAHALAELLDAVIEPGDVLLIKASRSVGLEKFGTELHSRAATCA